MNGSPSVRVALFIRESGSESPCRWFYVTGIYRFDRRLVCVPKFCPRECPGRQMCRYQRYLEESRKQDVFIQICNHNYLLADTFHRAEGYKPLLSDYRILVIDEAHGVQRKELLQRLMYDPQFLSKPHGLSGVSSSNSLL